MSIHVDCIETKKLLSLKVFISLYDYKLQRKHPEFDAIYSLFQQLEHRTRRKVINWKYGRNSDFVEAKSQRGKLEKTIDFRVTGAGNTTLRELYL